MHTSDLFRAFWLTALAGALCAAALGADEGAAPTAAPAARPAPGKPDLPEGWRLLYSQAFDQEAALGDFEFSDPKQWRWTPRDGDGCLEALPKGTYRPKLRSPFVIALLRDRVFRDFILEADLLQTSKEYGHRDMCVFFGFEAVARYYYVHLGTKHDSASHNVMIVNETPRKAVTARATAGVNWGKDVWHRVRIVRKTATGTVEVYFDDMAQPAITAEDKTFLAGRVGAGTFDDCGLVDNLRLWGPAVEETKTPEVFRPAAHGEKKP